MLFYLKITTSRQFFSQHMAGRYDTTYGPNATQTLRSWKAAVRRRKRNAAKLIYRTCWKPHSSDYTVHMQGVIRLERWCSIIRAWQSSDTKLWIINDYTVLPTEMTTNNTMHIKKLSCQVQYNILYDTTCKTMTTRAIYCKNEMAIWNHEKKLFSLMFYLYN